METGETATHASSGPSSPGFSPVLLSDCIEELLRFTLSVSLEDDSLVADVGLSKDYCARLLHDEPLPLPDHLNGSSGGVPMYPLYKHLARAIERCISSGKFLRMPNSMGGIPADGSLNSKEDDWSKLILDKGAELLKMFDSVEFELHVQEPYFSQLRDGLKTVEGRCAIGDYNRIVPGASLLFNKCLLLKVQHVNWYRTFREMLRVETLANVLPDIRTVEEGVQIYRKFYTEEKENSNGVLAISVSRPASQPYISMADLLGGLSYDGVGCLLGMIHTAGTISDALPPPRSALVSSAMKLHRPNVKGSSLTVAARALAKHVSRSSEGWWGVISGSDSNKNRLALEVINHLLTESCWINVHMIQPYECVFEIRVPEGYGARWSKDGSEAFTCSTLSNYRLLSCLEEHIPKNSYTYGLRTQILLTFNWM